jgi:hypothetical protein
MQNTSLLYEDKPKYDRWMQVLLIGVPLLILIIGLSFIKVEIIGTWIDMGLVVFLVLLFWAIMPHNYLIYSDRLVIKFGWPFSYNISLASVKQATKASSWDAIAYWGIRFATSTSNVVEIKRRGMGIIISPSNADTFLANLEQVLKTLPPASN